MPDTPEIPLGWSDQTVPLHTHACFYYTDEDALKRTLQFVRVGLDADAEFGVIFADSSRHDDLLDGLQRGYQGDVRAKIDEGKLAAIGGAPTRDDLLGGIASVLDAALARGHRLIRFLGFIAWGAPGWPDEDSLLEFESQVNNAVLAYPAVIICTYGVPKLSGRQLIEGGLVTHPMVFLNDRVLRGSALYVEPGVVRSGGDAA